MMRWLSRVALVVSALLIAAPASAQAPSPATGQPAASPTPPATSPSQPSSQPAPASTGPVYCVTYFEVAPAASRKTANLLRTFAAATRKEAGNLEFLALHESARPGRYAILEAWRDKAALDAHDPAMKALGDKLQAGFAGPFDARRFFPLDAAAKPAGDLVGAIYVLTHVDVFPAGKDQVAAMVKQLVADSRKDMGALRFDAVVWDGHPNHFHLVEAWANRGAREAHALSPHTKEFRAKLVPFEGALYDERLYEALR